MKECAPAPLPPFRKIQNIAVKWAYLRTSFLLLMTYAKMIELSNSTI